MTEQDKVQAEQFAQDSLGSMEEWNFSPAQKIVVIELMQRNLFPPVKLMIGRELVEIPSAQVMVFESQFAEFEECCVKNCKCSAVEWAEKAGSDESIAEFEECCVKNCKCSVYEWAKTGSDESIAGTLRSSYFGHLATPQWIAFLKHKIRLGECVATI